MHAQPPASAGARKTEKGGQHGRLFHFYPGLHSAACNRPHEKQQRHATTYGAQPV